MLNKSGTSTTNHKYTIQLDGIYILNLRLRNYAIEDACCQCVRSDSLGDLPRRRLRNGLESLEKCPATAPHLPNAMHWRRPWNFKTYTSTYNTALKKHTEQPVKIKASIAWRINADVRLGYIHGVSERSSSEADMDTKRNLAWGLHCRPALYFTMYRVNEEAMPNLHMTVPCTCCSYGMNMHSGTSLALQLGTKRWDSRGVGQR